MIVLLLLINVVFLFGVFYRLKQHQAIQRRIQSLIDDHVRQAKRKNRTNRSVPLNERLSRYWNNNQQLMVLRLRTNEYWGAIVILSVLGFAIGFLLRGIPGGIIMSILGAVGFVVFIRVKRAQWLKKFGNDLPDFLRNLNNSLLAGISLMQSMVAITAETTGPIHEEFERVIQRMNFGIPLEDALIEMNERVELIEVDMMVTAFMIQKEIGSSLTHILENIIQTITDRQRLQQEIGVLTSQGKLSGLMLGLLPVGVSIMVYFMDPTYMTPLLTTGWGWICLAYAAVSLGAGALVMSKMINKGTQSFKKVAKEEAEQRLDGGVSE